ncbi:Serine/threonine-protein kinase wnk4 [Mortierella sp. AD094]|nr:Serine/threonine-protein kinase wnk4 [Mortierella sp. AD094]
MGTVQDESNDTDGDSPLETDPTGRFQRLNEILGEGAYKHVYRAFDQEEGVEVAWNQLRIDHLTKKEAQKILSEIEILESIRNDHIINFYASWSTRAPNGGERVVFITELMSSGTLKQYLKKTLKGSLKPKVLKSWCRQILQGLVYLHTHNPPIIHRDLKCDNIFINGNNGQLKIGDLGLAVVRHRTHVSSVLGTPEFMAPELYDEKYDEKVDIYAFGMCVLEMVTKEYPYSECTNQAQIYRKVTQGIKPQSLDHVQDPETREFINRCLDHDDRTRPSAQELLDSEFLKPCAAVPPLCGSSMGFFNQQSKTLVDGIEMQDSPSSASITKASYNSLVTPTTMSSFSLPTPQPVDQPRTLPSSVKAAPQPLSIPPVAFTTTTTVDADNKTYHIRSNLVPQTPTSADQTPSRPVQDQQGEHRQETQSVNTKQEQEDNRAEPPTLHSHTNSKTCSIQVVQYGEEKGDQLNLKMICTCPVAGPRDMAMAAGTHEIKFPFDLNVDTVEEVVAEMIREQILSGDDLEEATIRIQELIDDVVSTRKERARAARELARAEKATSNNHQRRPSSHHHTTDHGGHKNGLHRQLKSPSVYDMEQYGTSPVESPYDHYSSVGSSASVGWDNVDSPVESDQGYGTVPPHPSLQPPVISESTFPPLNTAHTPRSKIMEAAEQSSAGQPSKQSQISYSEVVQNPLSPNLSSRDRSPVTSRPQSIYGLDQKSPAPMPLDIRPSLTNGTLAKLALRDAELAGVDKKKPKDSDDVGYTSPYRHGVSSSSISYHRRSPSLDASIFVASTAPAAMPLQTNPPEPAVGSSSRTQGDSEFPHSVVTTEPPIGTSNEIRSNSSLGSPTKIASMLALNGSAPQLAMPIQPATSENGLAKYIPSTTDAVVPAIPLPMTQQDHWVPQSTNAFDHEHQLLPLQTLTQPKPIPPSTSEPMMTSEAKKDIELWTSRILPTANGGTGYVNGSNYSSCPEMSDDEEILDEDLKILREKQRQELELMRLQHVQQWEKMMKLKVQKGSQELLRRKSDISNPGYPLVLSPLPPQ